MFNVDIVRFMYVSIHYHVLSLKLKSNHKCFLCPYKMLCFIAFRLSRTPVMMQVKRAIGKAMLHKLSIYNEYMCLCWVSTLFCMICCLFSNCSKNSTTRLRWLHGYIKFYLCSKCTTFLCARTPRNAKRRSIDIFYRDRENIHE